MTSLYDKIKVHYSLTSYDNREVEAVTKAAQTNIFMSDNVRKMEDSIKHLFFKQYGIMVNSGSSANYLAVEILDFPKGSEIITPVLTFITTVAPIIRNDLVPVFIDVEKDTFNIDVAQIENMISKNTKALLIPNLLGNVPDWIKIKEIADKNNLIIIEDSADTLGATINGKSTGVYSDISTTSFYGSHIITCGGNGGMICVNSPIFAERAKLLRGWGRSSALFGESENSKDRFNVEIDGIPYDAKFIFEAFGYNFMPSEIGAAFGVVQVEKLSVNIEQRIKWFNQHNHFMKKYEEYFILPKQLKNVRTAWSSYPLLLRDNSIFTRSELQKYLENKFIQTRTIMTGNILRQPCFTKNPGIKYICQKDRFENADHVMANGLLVGCHNGLTEEQVNYLYETINDFMQEIGKRKKGSAKKGASYA